MHAARRLIHTPRTSATLVTETRSALLGRRQRVFSSQSQSTSFSEDARTPSDQYTKSEDIEGQSYDGDLAENAQQVSANESGLDTSSNPVLRPKADLLDLPPKPKYPCPHITEEDLCTYMVPLYRRHWGIRIFAQGPYTMLSKGYHLKTYKAVISLVNDIAEIAESEKHHPDLLVKPDEVSVQLSTHTAIRPKEHPNEMDEQRLQQGATRRDIRFAYLLEQLWERKYLSTDQALPQPPLRSFLAQPRRLQRLTMLMKTYGANPARRGEVCSECGGRHAALACTHLIRRLRTTKPESPCEICGEMHWHHYCPSVVQSRKRLILPSPCPDCGGAHWRIDCPTFTPQKTLRKRTLPQKSPVLSLLIKAKESAPHQHDDQATGSHTDNEIESMKGTVDNSGGTPLPSS